jgi:hypothetical protein
MLFFSSENYYLYFQNTILDVKFEGLSDKPRNMKDTAARTIC